MIYITRIICKLSTHHEMRNVRSKFTRAAVLKKINEPLVFEDFKIADKLKDGQVSIINILLLIMMLGILIIFWYFQVRISVKFCSVNMSDALICSGLSEVKPILPFVPGFEIVGEVLESKATNSDEEEEDITVGDRVLVLNKELMGGFAEECIVDEKVCSLY